MALGSVFLLWILLWGGFSPDIGRGSGSMVDGVSAWSVTVGPIVPTRRFGWTTERTTYRYPRLSTVQMTRDEGTMGIQVVNESPQSTLLPANSDSTHGVVDDLRQDDDVWSHVGDPVTQESAILLLGIKSLGVDYGFVRTGLAVTVGYEPTPLAILSGFNLTNTSVVGSTDRCAIMDKNWTELERLCDAIVSYATAQSVQRIILGLPFHKNGTVATQTLATVTFGRLLAATVLSHLGPTVPVFLFDERYTSKDAALRLHQADRQRHLYGRLDAAAAGIILENYYQDEGVGAYPIVLTESVRQSCLQLYADRQRTIQLEQEARRAENEARRLQRRQHVDEPVSTVESSSRKKKKKKK